MAPGGQTYLTGPQPWQYQVMQIVFRATFRDSCAYATRDWLHRLCEAAMGVFCAADTAWVTCRSALGYTKEEGGSLCTAAKRSSCN